jgi:uncharacterized RDD family membrane protein YckC
MINDKADSPADSPTRTRGRARGQSQDQLSEEYTIDTPENVRFGYEVAGIGSRFIAALIDHALIIILLIGINIAIVVAINSLAGESSSVDASGLDQSEENWAVGIALAIYALLNFAILWGYYMLFEWLWHGQTLGKRIVHIRVVRVDSAPVGFAAVAVRNLVRLVDFLPVGYGAGVVTMFCNRQSRRLGDFAAGTLVVKDQGELTLDSLMSAIPAAAPSPLRTELPTEFQPHSLHNSLPASSPELPPSQDWSGIRHLTPSDYELVQETLARYRSGTLAGVLLGRVATAIATKLERAPSSSLSSQERITTAKQIADQVAFLDAVVAAYGRWVR